jgi:SulP family sulfate permease
METNSVKILAPLKKHILILQWLSGYSKKTLVLDTFAGITLAAYAIPVSLAYATLAGLPPQYGVYGYLLGGIFYALLGSSKQLAVGPTSAISLLIGTTLTTFANGNIQHWIDLSSLTAFIFAILSLLFYIMRMSSIINFINSNVLLGFKAGAAITIGMTQLPKLFGVIGGGTDFFSRFNNLIHQLPVTNLYVLIYGTISIAIIVAGEKLFPNKPVTILVVIFSIILILVSSIESLGIKTVGEIPSGLPKFHFPSLRYDDVVNVSPLAFACFLLAYIESVSTGRTLGQKNGYDIDARQELLALGAANLATSLGSGYPVSGGLSQSAVNDGAGAKTPMSLIIASFTIAICLLFLTGMLKNLPTALLACIVLVAIKSLINIKEFRHLWKTNRSDFYIALIALICVIYFGILKGVIIAATASLLLIIKIVSSPNIAFLGRIPGTTRYSDFKRHKHNEKIPHILLFRVESPILYFNVSNIYNVISKKIFESENDLKVVILDLSTSAYIDSSGARFIKKLYLELLELGISFRLAEAHSEVRDMLRKEDVEHLFGHVSRRDSLHDVVIDCLHEHIEWEKEMIQSQVKKWHI